MIRAALTALLLTPLLSACVYIEAHEGPAPAFDSLAAMPGEIEAIHAAAFTADQALFQVSSNGCTSKADIEPVVRRTPDEAVITLRRIRPDNCRRHLIDGVQIEYTFAELGLEAGEKARVNNPFLIR